MGLSAQLLLHELPCPLCLLQQLQFTVLAVGPILNIRFGLRPGHYALAFARCAVWLVIGLTR
jgi:disulfide bond formation protein DsbB